MKKHERRRAYLKIASKMESGVPFAEAINGYTDFFGNLNSDFLPEKLLFELPQGTVNKLRTGKVNKSWLHNVRIIGFLLCAEMCKP